MLDRKIYNLMKKKYGKVASWAVWGEVGVTVKSNTDNMDWIKDGNLLRTLNTGFVFVGLNFSGTHEEGPHRCKVWRNFHSGDNRRQNDFKLRFALLKTRYWGSYITDLIKNHPDVDSDRVMNYLRENPKELEKNISSFGKEIALLGGNPVLVALGVDVYKLLKDHYGDSRKYGIVKVMHYAARIGKEKYRKEVLGVLDQVSLKNDAKCCE